MPDSPSPKYNPILEWDPTAPEPESPDPNSATFARDFKSFVRKILLVTPEFPRFYADVLIDRAPNSNAAKILRKNYSKILEKVNMAVAQQKPHKNRLAPAPTSKSAESAAAPPRSAESSSATSTSACIAASAPHRKLASIPSP